MSLHPAARALLAARLAALPWPYGGVTGTGEAILLGGVGLLLLLCAGEALLGPPLPTPGGRAGRVAVAAAATTAAWALLGAAPLPRGLVGSLSPAALAWRAPEPLGPADPVFLSLAPDATAAAGVRGLAFAGLLWATLRVVRRSRDGLAVLLPVGLGGAAIAAYGLLSYLAGGAPFHAPGPGDSAPLLARRAHAPFVNANHLAAACAAAIPCLLALLASRRRAAPRLGEGGAAPGAGPRVLLLGALLGTAGALAATLSRGGAAAALFGAGAYALLASRAGPRRTLLLLGLALALAGAFTVAFGLDPLLSRWSLAGGDAASRAASWRMALRIAAEFPLTGAGAGSFGDVSPAVQPPDVPGAFDAAHCDPLDLLAGCGVPGLALGAAAVLVVLARAFGPWPEGLRSARVAAAAAGAGGLLALLVHSGVDFPLQMPALAAWAAALAGLALASLTPPDGVEREGDRPEMPDWKRRIAL